MKKEIWKKITIDGNIYSVWYFISNLGRVKSFRGKKNGNILDNPHYHNPGKQRGGYLFVGLSDITSRNRLFLVHRLVAHEFIGPRPKGMQINHKDCNKLNNHISNLEYLTPKENLTHAKRIKGDWVNNRGEKCGTHKLKLCEVYEIVKLYKTKKYRQKDLGKIYGVGQDQISRILNNKRWSHVNHEEII